MIAKIQKGTSVQEHILRMMTYFNMVKNSYRSYLRVSHVTLIIETLLKSFLQFKSKYVMNKLTFTLIKLLNDLTYYKNILIDPLKPSGEASVAESFKSVKKRKKHCEG